MMMMMMMMVEIEITKTSWTRRGTGNQRKNLWGPGQVCRRSGRSLRKFQATNLLPLVILNQ